MSVLRGLTVERSNRTVLARVGGIIVLTATIVGVIAVAVSAGIVERQQKQALIRRAELVAAMQTDALAGPLWEIDERSVRKIIEALRDRDPAIRSVAVYETDRGDPVAEALAPGPPGNFVTIQQPIMLRGRDGLIRHIGTLKLHYSTAEVDEVTLSALAPVVGLLVLSLVTAVTIISYMLNRVVLRPLMRLTQAAHSVAHGEYSARIVPQNGEEDRQDEIGLLTRTFNRMAETVQDYTQTLEHRVQERTEALADINRRIMDSINYAQLIQSSILPKAELLETGLADHFVLWRPRDVVSGDFYYFREVEGGYLLGVADCTGHGVPGAFMTMTASAVLNNVVDSLGAADPATLLTEVDAKVRAALHQDGAASAWEGGFDNGLDLALCLIRPAEGTLVYAGARLPLWVTGPEGITELRAVRRSLGYRSHGAEPAFTNQTIPLATGQAFYLCTDGLTDQCGGERGRSFGKRRLREVIEGCLTLPLGDQKSVIATSLGGFQGDQAQRDDITMVGFRVLPAARSGSVAESDACEMA